MKVVAVGDYLAVWPPAREVVRVGNKLRAALGRDNVQFRRGAYYVPARAAAEIEAVVGDAVAYDEAASDIVRTRVAVKDSQVRARLEVSDALADPDVLLDGMHFDVSLDRHQREAAAAISTPSLVGLALFDEQGTGKTLSTLAGFAALRERGVLSRLLVVTPKSTVGSWLSDARKLVGDRWRIAVAAGPAVRRRTAILSEHDVLIATYDTVVRDHATLRAVIGAAPNSYMLAVDESYYAKNRRAARTSALQSLRPLFARAIVLCGAPAPNDPWDLVSQVTLADLGTAFGMQSRPLDSEAARSVVEAGLQEALYLRRLKGDVLPDLPGQSIEVVPVPMAPHQTALYSVTLDELTLSVRSSTDGFFRRNLESFMARRSALLQICSHPGGIDPQYREIPGKLRAMDTLLDSLLADRSSKVVIWSWFRYSLDAIAQRYKRYGLVRIDGSVSNIDDRIRAIDQFQTNAAVRIFLGNAAAAGAGITLTAANFSVYESLSNQAAHYMQSIDRIHRRGQNRAVRHFVLLSESTIDEFEYERIRRKARLGRELLRDRSDEPITRTTFLRELVGGDP